MIKKNIIDLIQKNIDVKFIKIDDLTEKHKNHQAYSGGGHYRLIIVSDDFKKISLINRHRLIYNILKKLIKKEIHALSIKAHTIEEYKLYQ